MELPYISLPNAIPNDDYHNGEDYKNFCSSTKLKQMLISPKWCKYCIDHPEKSKISEAASSQGSIYHSILASYTNCGIGDLSEFEKEYTIFQPPINPKTGKAYGHDTIKYQAAKEFWMLENPGKEPANENDIKFAKIMIYELLNGNSHLSKEVRYLIKHGKAEESFFGEYQGGLFKYRTDLRTSNKIVDWKTCLHEEPKVENWPRKVEKMGYGISAAFYQFFDFLFTGKWRSFYWIAQEKDPPYDFNILSADDFAYRITRGDNGEQIAIPGPDAMKMTKMVDQFCLCSEENEWSGYSIFTQPGFRNLRIAVPKVPGYKKAELFEYFN